MKVIFLNENNFFSDFSNVCEKLQLKVCKSVKIVNKNMELTKEFYLMTSYRFELVLYFKNEGIIHY